MHEDKLLAQSWVSQLWSERLYRSSSEHTLLDTIAYLQYEYWLYILCRVWHAPSSWVFVVCLMIAVQSQEDLSSRYIIYRKYAQIMYSCSSSSTGSELMSRLLSWVFHSLASAFMEPGQCLYGGLSH